MKPTFYLSLGLFCAVLLLAESGLRQARVQQHLPAPDLSQGYTPFNDKLHALEIFAQQHGEVDCFFMGSSMVRNDLNPLIFAEAYQRHTREALTCYNLGIDAITASSLAVLVDYLMANYHPRFILWGVDARQFNQHQPLASGTPSESLFFQSPWARYLAGDFNSRGWLQAQSYLYRYLGRMPALLLPQLPVSTLPVYHVQGYIPSTIYNPYSPLFWQVQHPSFFSNSAPIPYEVDTADMAGFRRVIQGYADQVHFIFFEMPRFNAAIFQYAIDEALAQETLYVTVGDFLRAQNIPFWETNTWFTLPSTAYSDRVHMHVRGSLGFSHWLGSQVGSAVTLGWLEDQLPSTYLAQPPLNLPPAASAEALDLILPDALYQLYVAQDPPQGVFMPQPSYFDLAFLQSTLAYHIAWSPQPAAFDLLALFDTVQPLDPSTYQTWYEDQQPAHLPGVDYLLFDEIWRSQQTPENQEKLAHLYEFVTAWDFPPTGTTYYLWRVQK